MYNSLKIICAVAAITSSQLIANENNSTNKKTYTVPALPHTLSQLFSTGTKVYSEDKMEVQDTIGKDIKRNYVYGEKAMLTRFFFKKGSGVPWHTHEAEQITYVISGKMRFHVGKDAKEYLLSAGDILIIPSNVPHRADVLEDSYELDIFAPIRQDWLDGTDNYIKAGVEK